MIKVVPEMFDFVYVTKSRPEMSSVCVLRSAFCVMLGARRMLGATENKEFNNIY